ncbi:MAG: ABC transporter ATP-binding protein [Planctomycetota bacterium]
MRGDFVKGLLCIVPATALELLTLLWVRDVIDRIVAFRPDGLSDAELKTWWWEEVVIVALAVLALALIKGVFKYGMRWYVTGASRQFERLYRQDLFNHLTTLTPHDLRGVRTGDVMSRSVSDIEAVRMLLGPAVMYNAQALIVLPTALVAMAVIDPTLTAALLIPFAGLALAVKFAARPTQHWSHISQERLADLSVVSQESFSGIRVVKAFASEAFSASVFQRMGAAFLQANVRLATIRGMTGATITIVKDLGLLAILLLGGWHLVEGRLTLGDFVLFTMMLNWALWPLIAIGWMLGMYHRARAGAVRLNELFALQPSVSDLPGPPPPAISAGALEVRGLNWSWEGQPALRQVSFRVPAGTTLGITGRTGSGKSTLVQLVSRQLEPPAGTVFLDGRDVRSLPLSFLRRAMGVVPQDAFLFSESIRSNIAFAHDDLDLDTVRAMAATARVADDIEGFPQGYDQLLGERGVTLSGGQRQRTAIARTLAADPPVLILDDCLSAVDSVTEQEILRGLRETLHGRTALIVSHRVASLSLADRILVLDDGRVAEEGTHDELVARNGLYADLYQRQKLEAEIEAL